MEVICPYKRPSPRQAGGLLVPVTWLYQLGAGMHRGIRRSPRRPDGVDAVIISVGNLEAGGGGKTPFCIYLLRRLLDNGDRPAYISRGYGGEAAGLGLVTVVTPDRPDMDSYQRSRIRYVSRDSARLARSVGDEGAVVAQAVPEAPLLFSADKNGALAEAAVLFKPTHIVLDDAFQSWSVYRDIDIVLLDAVSPFGNGRLLPAGSLREAPAALKRAHLIGFNNVNSRQETAGEPAAGLSGIAPGKPVFGLRRRHRFRGPDGEAAEPDTRPVAALSSIARPEAFEKMLVEHGWVVELAFRYPDHHPYNRQDLDFIMDRLAGRGIGRLIVTMKDWVKLELLGMDQKMIALADLELELTGADPLAAIKKPQAKPAASS